MPGECTTPEEKSKADDPQEAQDDSNPAGEDFTSAMEDIKSSMKELKITAKDLAKDLAKDISSMSSALTSIVPYLSAFIKWEEFAAIQENPSSSKQMTNEEIYWRTLCTDQMPKGHAQTEQQYRQWSKSMSTIRKLKNWKVDSVSSVFKPLGFLAYLRSTWESYSEFGLLLSHSTYRRLGRTKGGLLVPCARVCSERR